MDSNSYSVQLKAGIFLVIGLLTVFSLVVYFGRFNQWTERSYPITVHYSNANGLLKGASVLLAGARIGDVEQPPTILPNMKEVQVILRINGDIKIPKQSLFSIGSSGLLGDRFVTVSVNENAELDDVLPSGSVVDGLREANISDLQRQVGEIMPKVEKAVSNITQITDTFKKDIFNKKGVQEIQESLANIQQTTASAAVAAQQAQKVMSDANLFIKRGNETMDSVKGAADNLKAFIRNLREHGIIFYRNTAK
jgi:phospholipid/cholesterol/gamma-HCH transport system substrate-binding protein